MGKTEDNVICAANDDAKKIADLEGETFLDAIRHHNRIQIVQHYDRKLLRDLAHEATCFASLCRHVCDWRSEQALGGHIGGTKEKKTEV
jgi:hypothetical protein